MDIHSLPKVELHCHLDGIVDPSMLRALQAQGHALPLGPEKLQAALPVRGFEDFIRWFEAASPLDGGLAQFEPILQLHAGRLLQQNVVYAEIMVAFGEIRNEPGDVVARFRSFRDFATSLEAGRLQLEFLIAFSRARSPEEVAQRAELILRLYEAGLVVGVAVAGWPERPVEPLRPSLRRLREAGLGIEIHAGEWAGPESVWDALEAGAQRIGHGVRLFDDPRLVRRVREQGVHIEMCPTSNLKTGSLRRLEDHPLRRALEAGLSFSLNTDDPGPFECGLEDEYRAAAEVFGFTTADFERMHRQALAARFQPRLRYLAPDGASNQVE